MINDVKICASTHPCALEDLEDYAVALKNAKCDYLHCDLMEKAFVGNDALSFDTLKLMDKIAGGLPLDVHLMACEPTKYFDACLEANANIVTIHYESFNDISKIKVALNTLQINGIKQGIAFNPSTPIKCIEPLLPYVQVVLVMSVVPGKSGQEFMLESLERIKALKTLRDKNGYDYLIEVDGGINPTTASLAVSAGADMLVSGSFLYKAQDKNKTILSLKTSC